IALAAGFGDRVEPQTCARRPAVAGSQSRLDYREALNLASECDLSAAEAFWRLFHEDQRIRPLREDGASRNDRDRLRRGVPDVDAGEHIGLEQTARIGNRTANVDGARRGVYSRVDERDVRREAALRIGGDRGVPRLR